MKVTNKGVRHAQLAGGDIQGVGGETNRWLLCYGMLQVHGAGSATSRCQTSGLPFPTATRPLREQMCTPRN